MGFLRNIRKVTRKKKVVLWKHCGSVRKTSGVLISSFYPYLSLTPSLSIYIYIYLSISFSLYIYIYIYLYIYIYIYISLTITLYLSLSLSISISISISLNIALCIHPKKISSCRFLVTLLYLGRIWSASFRNSTPYIPCPSAPPPSYTSNKGGVCKIRQRYLVSGRRGSLGSTAVLVIPPLPWPSALWGPPLPFPPPPLQTSSRMIFLQLGRCRLCLLRHLSFLPHRYGHTIPCHCRLPHFHFRCSCRRRYFIHRFCLLYLPIRLSAAAAAAAVAVVVPCKYDIGNIWNHQKRRIIIRWIWCGSCLSLFKVIKVVFLIVVNIVNVIYVFNALHSQRQSPPHSSAPNLFQNNNK